ncbi:MAG: GDP-L-fucose synthase [Ignavibacteriales bacterium]|nr:GDP-L-fucose synthase [Ignavibacteriales bacterium]
MNDLKTKRIYLAGHTGMVGSAILRELQKEGYKNIIHQELAELDLRNQSAVQKFFSDTRPELVIIAAAKVGGILANNTYRAEFLYDNLMIEANLIHTAYLNKVEKVVFLGSSCIYPKLAPQPLKEEYLLTDVLEFTNEPYAIAKIAGIKMCESYYRQYGCNYISAMPTNLYGPNDNFNLETSHVLPALIRKFHEAKVEEKDSVTIWGTGKPFREFMYVEDLANAIVFMMESIEAKDLYENGITHLNVGSGKDITISDLAKMISDIVEYEGKIEYDSTKPDGTPRKLMDVKRLNSLGWKYKTELKDGIIKSYEFFKQKYFEETK